MTYHELVHAHLTESAALKEKLIETSTDSILAAANAIAAAFRSGNKLLLCGNGGSAADCQHFAAEFVGRLTKEFQRPPLPAIALTTDTSFITAHANDVSFEEIFERQVQALGRKDDVLIGISTSGNSKNVIRAMKAASRLGVVTIALMGEGGQIADIADISIKVPCANTQYVQECHLAIEHLLCEIVEQLLFKS